MARILIGIMGPGETATPAEVETAYRLGYTLAEQGWVVLTGGRNVGVMAAACQGAKAAGGLTVGILPGDRGDRLSTAVDIPIFTDLGNARNNVNVLSSRVVIACGMGAGTASEVALALKAGRPVVLMQVTPAVRDFFQTLTTNSIPLAETVAIALQEVRNFLDV
jgi:hypothetical protein